MNRMVTGFAVAATMATASLSIGSGAALAKPAVPAVPATTVPAVPATTGQEPAGQLTPHPSVHPYRSRVAFAGPGTQQAAEPGQWQAISPNPLPFYPDTNLLLMNGDVMSQNYGTSEWWLLTPDTHGSYLDGTWRELPPMPDNYAPYDYCSAVLGNGDVVVDGGEWTYDAQGVASPSETNQGAVYDPATNTWTPLAPPSGWAHIGDASCAVMPNGDLLLANTFDSGNLGQVALLNPHTFTWTTLNPPGKADSNGEENWTLLPDGTILTVDAGDAGHAERYIPPWLDHSANGQWISAGATAGTLAEYYEMGPGVLMPDGHVFEIGASGTNAVYDPPHSLFGTGSWEPAPSFPLADGQQLDVCDGSAILSPGGQVIVGASPLCYNTGDEFFTFNGSQLAPMSSQPAFGPDISSFWLRPLMLPNGQVLTTYDDDVAYIYTPQGRPLRSWAPAVSVAPRVVRPGASYLVGGTQFNGLSQDENYGDDEDSATNYPLVRITNDATGQVSYQSAYSPSTMGVATGPDEVWTHFTASAGLQPGASVLQVVANGIASAPVPVQVR